MGLFRRQKRSPTIALSSQEIRRSRSCAVEVTPTCYVYKGYACDFDAPPGNEVIATELLKQRNRRQKAVGEGFSLAPRPPAGGLRPLKLVEYVGQTAAVRSLGRAIASAQQRGACLGHVLLAGPSGIGKTGLAYAIGGELEVGCHVVMGPGITSKQDAISLLMRVPSPHQAQGIVLVLDEIHAIPMMVTEWLYRALEEGQYDDAGLLRVLPPLTFVGTTTEGLPAPLRRRFHYRYQLKFYTNQEMVAVVRALCAKLDIEIEDEASTLVAARSRGTPGWALGHLRGLRDLAVLNGTPIVRSLVHQFFTEHGVYIEGLEDLDVRLIRLLSEVATASAATCAARLGLTSSAYAEREAFLVGQGYVLVTARGRKLGDNGRRILDVLSSQKGA